MFGHAEETSHLDLQEVRNVFSDPVSPDFFYRVDPVLLADLLQGPSQIEGLRRMAVSMVEEPGVTVLNDAVAESSVATSDDPLS